MYYLKAIFANQYVCYGNNNDYQLSDNEINLCLFNKKRAELIMSKVNNKGKKEIIKVPFIVIHYKLKIKILESILNNEYKN